MHDQKGQSALEYLMTYSWAILIVVIVVAALFALRIVNPNVQSQCILSAGLNCENIELNSNGILLVNIQQATRDPINITGIECNIQDVITSAMMYVPQTPSNSVNIPVGGNYTFTGIQCYIDGYPYGGAPGTTYDGALILNYTDQYTGFRHIIYGKIVVPIS